jgi:hypothetical protein
MGKEREQKIHKRRNTNGIQKHSSLPNTQYFVCVDFLIFFIFWEYWGLN